MKFSELTGRMPLACVWTLLALAIGPAISAQSWQTVLNYSLAPGAAATGHDLAADAFGNVFCGGNVDDSVGTQHGLVLRSDVTGANWLISDDTNPAPLQNDTAIWAMGVDALANIYSIGQITPASSAIPFWYIRKSSDAGLTWSTVDTYQYSPGRWIDATGFTADDQGNIYVVGWARDAGTRKNSAGELHWLVRKSSDAGHTWRLVDDVLGTSGAFKAGFVPGVGVFVVGVPYVGGTGWIVRRSATGEPGTWSTVDGPIARGAAHGVANDGQGNIYVTGQLFVQTGTSKGQPTGYYAWATRKSSNGGNTWTTVDLYNGFGQGAAANGITRTAGGSVVAVGGSTDSQGRMHWIVRGVNSAGVWTNLDEFQLAPGYHSNAAGATLDGAGNLLVTGLGSDAGSSHWIVRRFSANP